MILRFGAAIIAVVIAAATITVASAQNIPDERSRREAQQFFRTGQEFMSAEQFDKAADAFTQAVDKDPLFTLAHYQLGQAYMNLKRYASAIQAFQRCIDAARNVYSLGESGRFDVEQQRRDDINEMREYVRELQRTGHTALAAAAEGRLHDLENQRTSMAGGFRPPAEVLLSLGSAYFRNGDRAEAETEWEAAVQVNPKLAQAWNNLAVAYMQDGRKQDARNAVTSAEKAGFRVNPQLKKDIDAMR